MEQKIAVTVARAHKIAERLGVLAKEIGARATEQAELVDFGSFIGSNGISEPFRQKVTARGDAVLVDVLQLGAVIAAQSHVRAVIGRANVQTGIADLLTEQAGVNRLVEHYKQVLSAADASNALRPQDLALVEGTGTSGIVAMPRRQVSPLSEAQQSEIEALLRRAQKEAFGLSDKIAEKNASKVELTLAAALIDQVSGG